MKSALTTILRGKWDNVDDEQPAVATPRAAAYVSKIDWGVLPQFEHIKFVYKQ